MSTPRFALGADVMVRRGMSMIFLVVVAAQRLRLAPAAEAAAD
jgi:hypothetical protein